MSVDSWNLREGEELAPELIAVRLLGGGSTYEAYLCFDEITYSAVVVKVLRPTKVEDASAQRGLAREIAALTAVNHPVVIRLLRHEVHAARPYLVLEQADGPRLSSLLRRYGPLQEQQYLPLAIDMAAALHYFARIEHAHLDIKPSNIIMGAPARLIDFSIARPAVDAQQLIAIVGTDAYMAPEQCMPQGDFGVPDIASDVWGLGATLFEAIAGERPFPQGEQSADDRKEAHLKFPQLSRPPGQLPARTPETVLKVVRACLEPCPRDRPLPREVAELLQPVLEAVPVGPLAGFKPG